jgi:glucose-1-phosphate adenylyltransferase
VQVHLFDGYWEDIGTVKAFYDANLTLTRADSPFSLEDQTRPIYTHARSLPPTRCDGAKITHSLLADGCTVEEGCVIENCVIGLRCKIGKNVTLKNSVLMGADFLQSAAEVAEDARSGLPAIGIGAGSHIEGAIVDKNCRIGKNVRIAPPSYSELPSGSPVVLTDGIVVVPKETTLADGWKLPTR